MSVQRSSACGSVMKKEMIFLLTAVLLKQTCGAEYNVQFGDGSGAIRVSEDGVSLTLSWEVLFSLNMGGFVIVTMMMCARILRGQVVPLAPLEAESERRSVATQSQTSYTKSLNRGWLTNRFIPLGRINQGAWFEYDPMRAL